MRTDTRYTQARASRARRAILARREDRTATRELRAITTQPTAADAVALYELLAVVTL